MKITFNTPEGILDLNQNASGEYVFSCMGQEINLVGIEFSVKGEGFSLHVKPSAAENMLEKQEKTSEELLINCTQTSKKEDDSSVSELQPRRPDITVENVKKYIRANDYCYDYMKLEEHFYGRILNAKLEKQLYGEFTNIVRKAANDIAYEEKGRWVSNGSRKIEDGRYTKVNILKKLDE